MHYEWETGAPELLEDRPAGDETLSPDILPWRRRRLILRVGLFLLCLIGLGLILLFLLP